jgi:hypothetical protein
MKGINIGIGIGIGRKRKNWSPNKPLGGETPSMWVKTDSRSGLSLVDSVNITNNATILPAIYQRMGIGYFSGLKTRTQEHLLDGGDYTLFAEVSQLTDIPGTSTYQIMGFGLNSGAKGRGVYIGVKSGHIALYIGDNVLTNDLSILNGVINTVNTNFKPYGRLYMLMTINFTTKILSIGFYNSDLSLRGAVVNKDISTLTFNTNDNAYAFSFNSVYFGLSNFKKFNAIKTLSQCIDDTYVTDLQLHYPVIQGYKDMVGGLDLIDTNAYRSVCVNYSNHNNDWLLKYGYDIYQTNKLGLNSTSVEQIIPHDVSGNSMTFTKTNFHKIKSVAGSLTNINDADCKIRFVQDFFDRSNATIWSDLARGTDYNSAFPKDFHISKLNQRTLYEWLNVGYKGRLYIKCENNSSEDGSENCLRKGTRGVFQEIILYDNDKTLGNNKKVLTYTNDIIVAVLSGSSPSYDANNYIKLGYLKTDRPMITLRIDDYDSAEFPAWESMFNEYGIKGDIQCLVGRNANPLLTYNNMTFSHLKELYDLGWGVSSHGMDDTDLGNSAESVAEIDIPESQVVLRSKGFSCRNFAPHRYGYEAMWVREIASEYFNAHFSWEGGYPETAVTNPAILDIWDMKSPGIDLSGSFAICDQTTDAPIQAGIDKCKAEIDICATENRWVIFTFHGHTTNKEVGMRTIVDYAIANGLSFVTFDQGLANRKYL